MTDTTPDLSYLTPEQIAFLRERGYEPRGKGERVQPGDRGWWLSRSSTLEQAFDPRRGAEPGWTPQPPNPPREFDFVGGSDGTSRLCLFYRRHDSAPTPPAEPPAPTPLDALIAAEAAWMRALSRAAATAAALSDAKDAAAIAESERLARHEDCVKARHAFDAWLAATARDAAKGGA